MAPRIHVVAAVIADNRDRVLLSKRPTHVHQGGLWEFPGGKLNVDESPEDGLKREIKEELAISVKQARPLIQIPHDYHDKQILLDVWKIDNYEGEPFGAEGQDVCWVETVDLNSYEFPEANLPVLNAINLPSRYLITPEPYSKDGSWSRYLADLELTLSSGVELLQFRTKTLQNDKYSDLANQVVKIAHSVGCKVTVNCDNLSLLERVEADGIHLTSFQLMQTKRSMLPRGNTILVGASCHNIDEIRHANEIGCNFIVLGPVFETKSHPGSEPIGWETFESCCKLAQMPVYALGGMQNSHVTMSWCHGGQGVAGISAFWRTS